MPAARLLVMLLSCMLLSLPVASAEEYRLQVANLYRDSFAHFIDGPIRTGSGELAMPNLERALDSGDISPAALLTDRVVRYGWDDMLRGFGAVKARASVSPGEGPRRWDEVVWDGKPGERTVFVISASAGNYQEVYQVALNGKADGSILRYYVPYKVTGSPQPSPVVAYSLTFLRFHADRDDLWARYLSRSVSLADGLAAVIGINENPTFADWVYFVVEHPARPTTFKAVIGWERRRSSDRSNFEGGWRN
jgi:hypothetical protein